MSGLGHQCGLPHAWTPQKQVYKSRHQHRWYRLLYIFRTCKTMRAHLLVLPFWLEVWRALINHHCDISVFTSIHILHCKPNKDRPVFKKTDTVPFLNDPIEIETTTYLMHVLKRQLRSGRGATATCALLSPRSCGETNKRSQCKCLKNQTENKCPKK